MFYFSVINNSSKHWKHMASFKRLIYNCTRSMLLLDYTNNNMDFAASVYISAINRDRSLLNHVIMYCMYMYQTWVWLQSWITITITIMLAAKLLITITVTITQIPKLLITITVTITQIPKILITIKISKFFQLQLQYYFSITITIMVTNYMESISQYHKLTWDINVVYYCFCLCSLMLYL